MSADELRQAAETLRERAGNAQQGQWVAGYRNDWKGRANVLITLDGETVEGHVTAPIEIRDADYIATTQPGVGLALAQWLDNVAAWEDEGVGILPQTNLADAWAETLRRAADVARLINGT